MYFRMGGSVVGAVAFATMLSGCSAVPPVDPGARSVDVTTIPFADPDVANPLRGQYQNLLTGLFPQENPAQNRYPAWPSAGDASTRISWRDLQPLDPRTVPNEAPYEARFDFSKIDEALARYAGQGGRLTLRIYSYNSCCNKFYPNNTNIAVPDWLALIPGTTRDFEHDGIKQVVPDWNNEDYLAYFEQLLAELGRRYNKDERLSIFEFSGYGDFSENHIAYLRDELASPGPSLEDSERRLGYLSQFRDQSITARSIRRLVEANLGAFPDTQVVAAPGNPEIMRQLFADESVGPATRRPVGIRADCLGVQTPLPAWADDEDSVYVTSDEPLVSTMRARFSTAPVVTEWCQLPAGTGRGAYYEKGLRDTVDYHVSMTSSVGFPDQNAVQPMEPGLFALWARTNKFAGYRYSVAAGSPRFDSERESEWIEARWINFGAAPAFEDWRIEYEVADAAGNIVRRTGSELAPVSMVVEQSLDSIDDEPSPSTARETVRIDRSGLAAGQYTVTAGMAWNEHKPGGTHRVDLPPMTLARPGRDAAGQYPIATFSVP
ncbi:hypothetical protein C8K38_110123 [Rhodococcus sp. OK611]|uniref:hypothetical protein n=1 Tax=unclassified Rhodococcus (in: high G+C Gram-positive bacteria) TaxID=192944 RepID=UPI000BC80D03|nr:hypothetical protein C8K38_110123 [Rhodococcus sp. OK611]SNX91818.1 hypothetical protein SAMN05447004_111104 [Rhodococcus sp. OK270]